LEIVEVKFMLRKPSSRLMLTFLLAAFTLPLAPLAQSQDTQTQSVADAARRAKEQKKNAAKPVKIVTEDDLPARPPDTSDATPAASQPTSTSQAPAASPSDAPGPPAASADKNAAKTGDDPEYAKLKAQTDDAQKEIELLKRSLSLDQDTFLSNPDYVHDKAGKAKLEDEREQIAEKQQALDQLKAQLAAHKPPASAVPPKP
jgi:hypothetical protein